MEEEESLPPNWTKQPSKSYPGKFYYHNSSTNERRWTHPSKPNLPTKMPSNNQTLNTAHEKITKKRKLESTTDNESNIVTQKRKVSVNDRLKKPVDNTRISDTISKKKKSINDRLKITKTECTTKISDNIVSQKKQSINDRLKPKKVKINSKISSVELQSHTSSVQKNSKTAKTSPPTVEQTQQQTKLIQCDNKSTSDLAPLKKFRIPKIGFDPKSVDKDLHKTASGGVEKSTSTELRPKKNSVNERLRRIQKNVEDKKKYNIKSVNELLNPDLVKNVTNKAPPNANKESAVEIKLDTEAQTPKKPQKITITTSFVSSIPVTSNNNSQYIQPISSQILAQQTDKPENSSVFTEKTAILENSTFGLSRRSLEVEKPDESNYVPISQSEEKRKFSVNSRLREFQENLRLQQTLKEKIFGTDAEIIDLTSESMEMDWESSDEITTTSNLDLNDITPMEWEYIEQEINENIKEIRHESYKDVTNSNLLNKDILRLFAENNRASLSLSIETISNDNSKIYFVIDTNVFLKDLQFLISLIQTKSCDSLQIILVIPYVVLQELDYLKIRKNETVSKLATRAIRFLGDQFDKQSTNILGQSAIDADNYLITINSADDSILNCCLQIKQKTKYVALITNDNNLKNKARCSSINCFTKDTVLTELKINEFT